MTAFNAVLSGQGTTVFEVMSGLAREKGAINLGQGFPDGTGPEDLLDKAAEAVRHGYNQYPPMLGLPELRQAVASHFDRFYDLGLDWQTETMVTSGATEALAGAMLALLDEGDEVVLFEPMYDAYLPLVKRAGGVPRFVTLEPPDFRLTREALEAAMGPKTKAVLFNNPHNPSARVFDSEEMALLAEACTAADAVLVTDEVYEHIVFDGRRPVSMMSLPGMRERTVKIGSAGKTFSLTGWKVGYVAAAPELMQVLAKAHQFLTFTTPPNLQTAVAYGLTLPDAYFAGLGREMAEKRDLFVGGLTEMGLSVTPCEGSYFCNIDISGLVPRGHAAPFGSDRDFCRWLIEDVGVAAIPVSAFYASRPMESTARFCFAKQEPVLRSALVALKEAL